MSRVLIVKLGAIGDVIMAIPAVHELFRNGHEIDWICGKQVLPLLERYSWIRPIAVDEKLLFGGSAGQRCRQLFQVWSAVGGQRYELCATLYYDARYRILSLPVRARRRLLLSHTDRSRRLLPGRHHTDEYLRVLLGKNTGPETVRLAPVRPDSLPPGTLGRVDGRARVALVPGGARNLVRDDALRRWPIDSYLAVARALIRRDVSVALIGGPDDRWAADAFAGLDVTDMIGRLSLVETLAWLDASEVVVTHDTGPLHLAGLTRAGIVSIFGPTDPWGRLPQRAGTVAIWGGEGFACRPCYDGHGYAQCSDNLCVQQVTPDMVIAEVERLIENRRNGAEEPPRVVTPRSTVSAGLLFPGTRQG